MTERGLCVVTHFFIPRLSQDRMGLDTDTFDGIHDHQTTVG